jgi:4'-phosphopantetheinyl transferase
MSKIVDELKIEKQIVSKDHYFYCIDISQIDHDYLLGKLKNLPIDEQRRFVAYRNGMARRMFLCSRLVIREELGHFGVPYNSKIKKNENGKPYSKYYSMYVRFSVSHSGNKLIIGFSHNSIGVDVEQKVSWTPGEIMEYANIVFHPDEIKMFNGLTVDEVHDLYTRLWVAKESYVKFTGEGAGLDTRHFCVCNPESEWPTIKGVKENIQTLVRKTDDDYYYAVTVEKND